MGNPAPRGYLWASLGLHLAIGLSLLGAQWQAGLEARPTVSRHEALLALRDRQDDLKRRLQSLERIARQLGAEGDGHGAQADNSSETDSASDPAALERRLRRAADQIQAAVLPERARDLARMLGIPEEAARATLLAEARAESAQGLDALQQQAQDALDFRRRQRQQAAGFPLAAGNRSSGIGAGSAGPSGLGQIGSLGPGESLVGDIVDRRAYGPLIEPPVIDSASLRLGSGRIVGATGALSNRLYVDHWYLIVPFAGIGEASLSISHPPERAIDLDAVYAGKQGRPLRWAYQRFAAYPLIPPSPEGGSLYYGYTEIRLDQARSVWMSFGADDDAKVWINDEPAWVSSNANKPWYFTHFKFLTREIADFNLTEATRRVHLRKGRNRILFKLYNSSGATFFSLVIAP